jgi:hypothetical protein
MLDAVAIIEPETVIRWHRTGFRSFWRWKSRRRVGRPRVSLEMRRLIREMNLANPPWGAPRIHGELLKLGIDGRGQTSVAKYKVRHRKPPSQGWRTFLANHVDGIASIDLFVVGRRRPGQPWKNGYAECLIASIRRECLDHVVIFGEPHLSNVLRLDQGYYNSTRTHLSLSKDAPRGRPVQAIGSVLPLPPEGAELHQGSERV